MRTLKILGGEVETGAEARCMYTVGQALYLYSTDVRGRRPRVRYHVNTSPEVTNMGRRPRLRGWLGTTNDVAAYALGLVVIEKITERRQPRRGYGLNEEEITFTLHLRSVAAGSEEEKDILFDHGLTLWGDGGGLRRTR